MYIYIWCTVWEIYMCVCAYMYVYVYVYVCIYICIYIYFMYMCICIYIYVYICKYVYMSCLCVCAYVGVAKIPACSSFSWSTFQLDRATAASLCRGSTSPTRASWIPKRKRPQNSIGNSLWYGYSCSTRLKLRNSQIIIDCYLPKMMPILPNSLQDCTFGANMPKKNFGCPLHYTLLGRSFPWCRWYSVPHKRGSCCLKQNRWMRSLGTERGNRLSHHWFTWSQNRRDDKTLKHLEIVWVEHRSLQDVCFDSIRGSHEAARKWHSEGTALNCWFDYCRFALAWAPVANLL
jgi:hypothetical protein